MENNLFGGEDYEYLSVEEEGMVFLLASNIPQCWEDIVQSELMYLENDLNNRFE